MTLYLLRSQISTLLHKKHLGFKAMRGFIFKIQTQTVIKKFKKIFLVLHSLRTSLEIILYCTQYRLDTVPRALVALFFQISITNMEATVHMHS